MKSKSESEETPHVPIHEQRLSGVDREKQRKAQEKAYKALRLDMAQTFGTPEGKRVLQWLAKQSGFGLTVVGGNPQLGMDIEKGTFYNACRQALYLELRTYIPAYILRDVEYENVNEEIQ